MSTVTAPVVPFKGLSAFGDSDLDALFFFGREREREIVVANLMAARLTVLYGPSGVGKSSLLRAGVAHALHGMADARVVVFSSWPENVGAALKHAIGAEFDLADVDAPLGDVLAAASAAIDGDVYLVLDQFEEYFLYHEGEQEFASELAETIRRPGLRANVLIGIREDALAKLDAFKSRIPGLFSNSLRLDRLDRTAGEAAIVGPVNAYNGLVPADERVEIEPTLTAAVLDEVTAGRVDLGRAGRGTVGGQMDGRRIEAPYLQLVLERLWEEERSAGSNRLQLQTLRDLGGSARIVDEHLERAMAGLSDHERETAAQMYHHLVTPSGTKIAHRVGDLAGYASVHEDDAATVLDKLTRERIVRASSDNGPASTRYEIYHDILADAVVAWRGRHEESRALARAEERRRRAHIVAAAALVGLLVVAAIAVFALVERGRERTQARRAHAQQLAAEAITKLDSNPSESVQLALSAALLQRASHEEEVLRNALTRDRQRAVLRADGPVRVGLWAPSGRRILVAGDGGKARVYDRAGRLLSTFVHGAAIRAAAFGSADAIVATGGKDGTVKLWRGGRASPTATLAAGGPVRSVAFAAHGTRVFAVTSTGIIRAWTLRGNHKRTVDIHTGVHAISGTVAPSGRWVVITARDRYARVYSAPIRRLVHRLAQRGYIGNVAFSPDEHLVLTSGNEGTVRLWRVGSWRLVRVLHGPGAAVTEAVFNRDGSLVGAASNDGTSRVWETATGFQRTVMIGHTGELTSVAFNPDSTAVVTASSDGTARVWDIGGRPASVLAGHGQPLRSATFSPDGAQVLTVGDDATARLWDPGSEPELQPIGRGRVVNVAASSDGRRFVTGGDGLVLWSGSALHPIRRLVDSNTELVAISPNGGRAAASLPASHFVVLVDDQGRELTRLRAPRAVTAVTLDAEGRLIAAAGRSVVIRDDQHLRTRHEISRVDDLAVSPDGAIVATAGADGVVRLRDPTTWKLLRALRGHTGQVNSVDFSPDGTLLLSTSRDQRVRVWRVADGRVLRTLHWHFGPVADAAISNDMRWLVTAGPETAGIGLLRRGELFRPGSFLRGPKRPLTSVAFVGAADRTVIAASKDGHLRAFRCITCGDVNDLIRVARARLRQIARPH